MAACWPTFHLIARYEEFSSAYLYGQPYVNPVSYMRKHIFEVLFQALFEKHAVARKPDHGCGTDLYFRIQLREVFADRLRQPDIHQVLRADVLVQLNPVPKTRWTL
jgi:hypothetical protein